MYSLEQEREDDRKAALAATLEAPGSKRKKRKRTKEIVIPRAPRNTTQSLLHTDADADPGAESANPATVSSMQGLFSRETLRMAVENSDASSSDEDGSDRESKRFNAGGELAFTYAASPYSPHSQGDSEDNHHSDDQDLGTDHGSDTYVAQLQEENKALKERIALLEEKLRQKDGTNNAD
jgi:hypothetical protein